MEGEECMEHSPAKLEPDAQGEDEGQNSEDEGEVIDLEEGSEASVVPHSSDNGDQDMNVNAWNTEKQGDSNDSSDSEESPESPPAQQMASPMDQECPVVDEEHSMNVRSPVVCRELAEEGMLHSPADGIRSPGGGIRSPGGGIRSPEFVGICSPEDFEPHDISDVPQEGSIPKETVNMHGLGQEDSNSGMDMHGSDEQVRKLPSQAVEITDPIKSPSAKYLEDDAPDSPEPSTERGAMFPESTQEPAADSSGDGETKGEHSAPSEHHQEVPASPETTEDAEPAEDGHVDVVSADVTGGPSVDDVPRSPSFDDEHLVARSLLPSATSPAKADEPAVSESNGSTSSEEDGEDIYSLDLTEGCYKSGGDRANASDLEEEGDGKDSESTRIEPQDESRSSQGVDELQTSAETGAGVHDIHSSMQTSHPRSPSDVNTVSGASEVPPISLDDDSVVHSTSEYSGKESSLRTTETGVLNNSSDVAREESARTSDDSDDVVRSRNIPNGHDMSPDGSRDDDDKAGKVQTNTSFNEDHVELDYDEEEGDEGHGHEDRETEDAKHRDGSGDEKQDGELSSSDGDEDDDGELDDDEDCEEGEIREPGRRPFVKPICRFFMKGNCTWGNNCRFLHPGVNDKGNYRLFDNPNYNGGRLGLRARLGGPVWGQEPGPEVELPPPPPPPPEPPAAETAWERGLRHAKEMRKKANMRKEQETDFEEKRMNLSLDEERELNKENERTKYVKDPYYDQYDDDDEYYGKSRVHGWEAGSYENFEVRWTREQEFSPFREKEREREHFKERRYSPPLDRIERLERQMFDQPPRRDDRRDKYREERVGPPIPSQAPRGRADEWHDPWQRSKSPSKLKKRSSRSHSRGRRRHRSYSVSSHSSSSYSSSRSRSSSLSSRSSRSSYSRSSSYSSRSPSPRPLGAKKPVQPLQQKKLPPLQSGKNLSAESRRVSAGKKVPPSDERKVAPQAKNNDQPRSAVSVRSKQRSPDKWHGGPPVHPGRPVRPSQPLEERGRPRGKVPLAPPPRSKPHPGSRSSSGSSFSRSRSRSSSSSSFSRSGSASSGSSRSHGSRSRSSSTSSSGSADSDHLYRDLPNANRTGPLNKKRPPGVPVKGPEKRPMGEKPAMKPSGPPMQGRRRPDNHDRDRDRDQDRDRGRDRDREKRDRDRRGERWQRQDGRGGMRGKPTQSRQPTTPVKPKDPLKLVGQKSNIKLTLLNKHAEKSGLIPGAPPKRRISDSANAPPPKRPAIGKPGMVDKPKPGGRMDRAKSPPLPKEKSAIAKPAMKASIGGSKPPGIVKAGPLPGIPHDIPPPPSSLAKPKKSMSSRREELLKQLKAVEDAIARKKSKMQ